MKIKRIKKVLTRHTENDVSFNVPKNEADKDKFINSQLLANALNRTEKPEKVIINLAGKHGKDRYTFVSDEETYLSGNGVQSTIKKALRDLSDKFIMSESGGEELEEELDDEFENLNSYGTIFNPDNVTKIYVKYIY